MPYISKEAKKEIDPEINTLIRRIQELCDSHQEDPDGMVNYAFTRILRAFFGRKYVKFERGIGCLECAKLEFYRRAVAPYEDQKSKENGDVYQP